MDLSARCRLPVTLPQLMGLLQGAQQGGGLPRRFARSAARRTDHRCAGRLLPAQPSPGLGRGQGTGPLPGPATAATR